MTEHISVEQILSQLNVCAQYRSIIKDILILLEGTRDARDSVENSCEPCNEACTQAVDYAMFTDEEIDHVRKDDDFVDALWEAMCKTNLNFKQLNC